jgi:hypothetical protein
MWVKKKAVNSFRLVEACWKNGTLKEFAAEL